MGEELAPKPHTTLYMLSRLETLARRKRSHPFEGIATFFVTLRARYRRPTTTINGRLRTLLGAR